jgi:branched-subunit amino acid transport protein
VTGPAASLPLLVGAGVLGLGTYAFRLAGIVLSSRVQLPARLETLLSRGVVVLLAAVVATATVLQGAEFAGPARVLGVVAGGLLAWRRAPFVVVVLAAAATAAGLRLLGVP